ncbi:MAG: nuclear transport factor 2 family protein [Acidimicrobiales bacterium]
MSGGLERVIDAYVAAWNEPDAAARAKLLDEAVVDEFVFEGPSGHFRGRPAVEELIAAMRERMPGTEVIRIGDCIVRAGGEPPRFGWEIRTVSGQPLLAGTDKAEVGDDGRLRRVEMEGFGGT